MSEFLTDEDRVALAAGTKGDYIALFSTVERIVRRHRTQATVEALHEAARRVGYAVEWDEAPLSVESWLHDRAYTLEMTDE